MSETGISELESNLRDRHWRLNNLYWITDKRGREIKFSMSEQQLEYYENLHYRNLILKARQLGFTTEQCIIQLDAAIFEGARCALIADREKVALRLFREKTLFAYERLPEEIKISNPLVKKQAGELVFANGGSVYLDVSFRGGTLTWLHISEFGKICAKFPEKAREIVTGAFEAVGIDCVITIESTAEGQEGYFYDYSISAELLLLSGKTLTPLDWRFFFFPWFKEPAYSLNDVPDDYEPPQRLFEYFEELEAQHEIVLTPAQKLWYAKKEATLGDDMWREYPSTPAEAFKVSVEGAYYAKQFKDIYRERRICRVPYDPAVSVHTIWDIGVDDTNSIWFVQRCGREWHVIDYYANSGEGLGHYIAELEKRRIELKYQYGIHIGPHDLAVREWGNDGKTRKQSALERGIDFTLAPNVSVMDGIDAVRNVLPLCWFDESKTDEGLSGLQSYRKEWDDKLGKWKDRPLHDANSHPADSFRYFAVSVVLLDAGYTRKPLARGSAGQPNPKGWT